jgi:hypothetical protein
MNNQSVDLNDQGSTMNLKLLLSKTLIGLSLCLLVACGGGGGSSAAPAPVVTDTDGDGVADTADAFPNDASESADADSDNIGDNADNCPDNANEGQTDSDANGQGDACDAMPEVYAYTNSVYTPDSDSVSYTGQTARHLLISGMVDYMSAMTESGKTKAEYVTDLDSYMDGDGADGTPTGFKLKNGASDGSDVKSAATYGDVSSGKNLDGKIAGGNGEGGGETSKLIGGEFFGWSDGLSLGSLPINLVDLWIDQLATQASDGTSVTISTVDGDVNVSSVHYDAQGRNQRQLLQKFLLGAVTFSQGTNDYFQADFATQITEQEGTKNYSAAEHNYDEAFGYYGAARDNKAYTDLEARAKSGRDEWKNGYYDTDGDGMIDPRSEFNFGNSQNCAKRDVGSAGNANPTDLSSEAMDAFLAGRQILSNTANAGTMSASEEAALAVQIKAAALAWEKCIAATVIHYINDVTTDMGKYSEGSFADVGNFTDVGKHWSEMKGFALGLQFSPFSPFRDETVTSVDLNDLKTLLSDLGDAPMLADGSQGGVLASDTDSAIAAYTSKLASARQTLQEAYGFNADNVAGW